MVVEDCVQGFELILIFNETRVYWNVAQCRSNLRRGTPFSNNGIEVDKTEFKFTEPVTNSIRSKLVMNKSKHKKSIVEFCLFMENHWRFSSFLCIRRLINTVEPKLCKLFVFHCQVSVLISIVKIYFNKFYNKFIFTVLFFWKCY